MKKQLLTIVSLITGSLAIAQVGINNTTPATTLDITAKNATGTTTAVDGLMIPRVDRQRAQSMNSVPTSTMIYVNNVSTGAAAGIAVNIDAVGFYYYNGTVWTKMGTGSGGATITADNGLTATAGNVQLGAALIRPTTVSGLTAANTLAFTGTGANAFSVDANTLSVDASNHRVGFGTTSPTEKVQVFGNMEVGGTGTGALDSPVLKIHSNGNAEGVGGQIAFYENDTTFGFYINHNTAGGTTWGAENLTIGARQPGTHAYNPAKPAISVGVNQFVGIGTSGPAAKFHIDGAEDNNVGSAATAAQQLNDVVVTDTGKLGVSTISPAATADIAAKAATGTSTAVDGILIPRVTRERAQSMNSVPVSTLVYITEAVTGTQTNATQFVDAAGFYYSDGTNWLKMGASTTAATVNVTAELDANYTALATDDIILFNTTANRVLTLPTSGIAIGKKYYISMTGSNGIDFAPASAIRNTSYNILNAGTSATIMYIGGGKWDVMTGY